MAKVRYSGGGNWTIGPYAYVHYGAEAVNRPYTNEANWPNRIRGIVFALATEKEIYDLVLTIFDDAGHIEVK